MSQGPSRSRQTVKNARRRRRHGNKKWLQGKPMMKAGMGGTDKTGTVKPSRTYYSQGSAEIIRGKPNHWPGLKFRPK